MWGSKIDRKTRKEVGRGERKEQGEEKGSGGQSWGEGGKEERRGEEK